MAKIADFSHSVWALSNTEALQYLPGGTEIYAAPEWRLPLNFGRLQLTDVYSYGLVFICLMAGREILRPENAADLSRQKYNGTLLETFRQHSVSFGDPSAPTICEILELTIQTSSDARKLNDVVRILYKEIGHPMPATLSNSSSVPRQIIPRNIGDDKIVADTCNAGPGSTSSQVR